MLCINEFYHINILLLLQRYFTASFSSHYNEIKNGITVKRKKNKNDDIRLIPTQNVLRTSFERYESFSKTSLECLNNDVSRTNLILLVKDTPYRKWYAIVQRTASVFHYPLSRTYLYFKSKFLSFWTCRFIFCNLYLEQIIFTVVRFIWTLFRRFLNAMNLRWTLNQRYMLNECIHKT